MSNEVRLNSGQVFLIILYVLAMTAYINWQRRVAYKRGYDSGYTDCKLELVEKGAAE